LDGSSAMYVAAAQNCQLTMFFSLSMAARPRSGAMVLPDYC
jgi:hypothetical protein